MSVRTRATRSACCADGSEAMGESQWKASDKYGDKMAELGSALRQVADLTKREPLSVAIEAARDADGLTQCYVLAAAVELAEPSNTRDQHIRDAGTTLRPSVKSLPREE